MSLLMLDMMCGWVTTVAIHTAGNILPWIQIFHFSTIASGIFRRLLHSMTTHVINSIKILFQVGPERDVWYPSHDWLHSKWDRSPKTLSSYDDERNKQHLTFIQLKHSQVTSVYGVWHYITEGWAHLMLHCMNFSPCASLSLMLPPPMLKPSTTARLSPITSRARCLCSFRICHKKRDSHSTLYFIFINFSK